MCHFGASPPRLRAAPAFSCPPVPLTLGLVVFAPPPVGGLGLRGTWAVVGLGLRGTWAASRGGEARGRLAPPGAVCSRGPCCRAAPLPRWLGVRSASVCSPPQRGGRRGRPLKEKKGKRRAAAAEHTADTVPACLPLALLARCWLRLATSWVCWVGLVQFQYSCKASDSERSTSF